MHYKQYGFVELMKKIRRYIVSPKKILKVNIAEHYSYINRKDFGVDWYDGIAKENTINWVIPNFSIGSGGHLNIFRFISFLEQAGYEVNIVIDEADYGQDTIKLSKIICENFVDLKAKVFFGLENAPLAYSVFASSWTTAYTVKAYRSVKKKFYFVQDFEPMFYPSGSEYSFSENTYRFGFTGITAGKWLSDKLSREYGMECDYVGFSYDKDRYIPLMNKRHSKIKRVFFYARPPTPRRALELGVLALQKLANERNDIEVVFAGWNLTAYDFQFKYESHGVVSLDDLPKLYTSCDVALVISFTNLSLLPLELMASGVPVVSNKGPNVEWLLNDKNCQFASSDADSMAAAIIDLIDDNDKRYSLRQAGISFAEETSWNNEALRFIDIYDGYLKGESVDFSI